MRGITAGNGGREQRREGPEWQASKLLLYDSGRAEVVLSDGSGIILHPGADGRTTYFQRDGARQRLLASCATDGLRAKVLVAAALRSRFLPHPAACRGFCPAGERALRHRQLRQARWPSCEAFQGGLDPSGAVRVEAAGGVAVLVLAPHGCTYAVEWWRPSEEPCRVEGRLVPEAADAPSSAAPAQRLFSAGGAAAGVLYEHVRQVQCFAVDEAPMAAWSYPLLLALMERRRLALDPAAAGPDRRVAAAAVALRRHLDAGPVVAGEGGEVCAPLPLADAGSPGPRLALGGAWDADEASPAAALGAAGAGLVRVVWTPAATAWLHDGEATIDASGDGTHCRVLSSAQKGRFWAHVGAAGEQLEVLLAEAMPLDAGGLDLAEHVAEVSRWLRHNRAEAAGLAAARRPAEAALPPERPDAALGGWVPEAEAAEEAVGRLSLFRPAGGGARRLARVLFEDSARLEFFVAAGAAPGDQDTFRLLDPRGCAQTRSFGLPLGCERYALAARALLARALSDPAEECQTVAAGSALAEAEARRTALLLRLHGGPADRGAVEDLGGLGAATAAAAAVTVGEALQQNFAARLAIEGALGLRALQGLQALSSWG